MNTTLHKMWLLYSALSIGCVIPVSAQNAQVRILSIDSPAASPQTEQPVKLSLWNYGTEAAASVHVKILQSDVVRYDSDVTIDTTPGAEISFTAPVTLLLEYGGSDTITAIVDCTDPEGTTFSDTQSTTVDMPQALAFPYTVDMETVTDDFKTGGTWRWDANSKTFSLSGRNSNWRGGLTSQVFPFPTGEPVTCRAMVNASKKVRLQVDAVYGLSDEEVIYVDTIQPSAAGLAPYFFSFTPKGPAQLRFSAKLIGSAMESGQLSLLVTGLYGSAPDLSADAIIAPALTRLAKDDNGWAVTASFTNSSPFDINAPEFSFSAGTQNVRETYPGTVKAGSSITYTFNTRFLPTQDATTLTVACSHPEDVNTSNNSVSREITFYDALPFPYATDFENGFAEWSTLDLDGDNTSWTGVNIQNLGNCAYYNNTLNDAAEDYLISPGVDMPAGKSRISFYWGPVREAAGTHLKAYFGRSPLPDDTSVEVFDGELLPSGIFNAYKLLDLEEAGVYYLSFKMENKGQVVIDNVKIDTNEDLCIDNIAFDTGSGYNKTTANVTISYKNHGVTPQSDISLQYFINNTDTPAATETDTRTIAPGETVFYTFKTPADISEAGTTYQIFGRIATTVGDDTLNDMIEGEALSHFVNRQTPYFNNFDTGFSPREWSFSEDTAWSFIQNQTYCYSPYIFLRHVGPVEEGKTDWIFSECVEIPEGEYDLSLMYRTELNYDTDPFRQNLRIALFSDCNPDALVYDLYCGTGLCAATPWYNKINATAEVATGKYYIGIGSNTPGSGQTNGIFIDDLSLSLREMGHDLPYESDFRNNYAEWTAYNNARDFQGHWSLITEDDGSTALSARRDGDMVLSQCIFEDKIVSPCLRLTAGHELTLTVEYSLSADDDTLTLDVFGSTVDNPRDMQYIYSLPVVDGGYARHTFTVNPETDADTPYYIAFRTSSPEKSDKGCIYDARIKSVKAESTNISDGIRSIDAESGILIEQIGETLRVVTPEGFSRLSVFTPDGIEKVRHESDDTCFEMNCASLEGLHIVTVTTAQGMVTRRFIF